MIEIIYKDDNIRHSCRIKEIEYMIYKISETNHKIKKFMIEWFNNIKDIDSENKLEMFIINNRQLKEINICEKILNIYKFKTMSIDVDRIYIDKKYYEKYREKYNIDEMISNISVKYYKKIIKTFKEYYVNNFNADKSDNYVLFYSYCLKHLLKCSNHDHLLGYDNDKMQLKIMLLQQLIIYF